jgi:MraZ protein
MMLFNGTYYNKIDANGRVSLPSEFRHALPEEEEKIVYIFPSPRLNRLEAMSEVHFHRICEEIESSAAMFSDEEDDMMAQIVASARRFVVDGNGRILLPRDFTSFAHIDAQAVFVGFVRRFVIFGEEVHKAWQEEKWQKKIRPFRLSSTEG